MEEDKKFNFEEFFDFQKETTRNIGFIEEISLSYVKDQIMRGYKRDFVRVYFIEHIITTGDGFHLKWKKRFIPLTEETLDKLFLKD